MMDTRLPRYQLLRDDLANRIAALEWRADDPLPTEQELAATYGVAIGTVRKAIDVLETEGVVSRFQGRGTFIRRPRFDHSLLRFFRFLDSQGRQRVPESRIRSRAVKKPTAAIAERLGLVPAARALRIERLRLIDARPFVAEEIWLPLPRFDALCDLPLTEFGDLLYPLYERRCGQVVATAKERLTVDASTPADMATLQLARPGSVVAIARTAFGLDGSVLEWRLSRGDAAHFSYTIDIR